MEHYSGALGALFLMGLLLLINVLVLDFALVKGRHVPGTTVSGEHGQFLFRANRALANLNETFAGFIALVVVAILARADPILVNVMAMVFALARLTYATAYYCNAQRLRSIAFGFSVGALLFLVVIDGVALVARA